MSGAENAVDLLALIARQQEEVVRLREEQGKLIGQLEQRIEQLQSTLLETQAKAFKDLSKEQGTCTICTCKYVALLCLLKCCVYEVDL